MFWRGLVSKRQYQLLTLPTWGQLTLWKGVMPNTEPSTSMECVTSVPLDAISHSGRAPLTNTPLQGSMDRGEHGCFNVVTTASVPSITLAETPGHQAEGKL